MQSEKEQTDEKLMARLDGHVGEDFIERIAVRMETNAEKITHYVPHGTVVEVLGEDETTCNTHIREENGNIGIVRSIFIQAE